ncbi:hypothetical protein SAMN05421665_2805 [Yoonia rosea]|uniref:Ribosomal protein L7/L12 C-terminal domain-containing protein n=1 Tax=Yoonia rosea TaxID=287098 RepID=A0A1R3XD09_9RHOB|nr:hypothetical protein [Yoonia rosea]SIT88809.1 hypothetical protein SAMN05421665_2805 [Yoonia rosea]
MDHHSDRVARDRPVAPFAIIAVLVAVAFMYADGFLSAALVLVAFGTGYLPWGRKAFPAAADARLSPISKRKQRRMGRDALRQMSDPDIARLLAIVQGGRKLEAVKEMRDIGGFELRQAKEAIDLLQDFGQDWRHGPDPDWQQ